jgi:hypothetical protein
MAQQQSPWLEGAYGWNFGEGGWNTGMDSNLLKFSFLFDRNIDGVVGSLPAAVNGQAYFLTTDSRLYFAVGSTWFSSPVPKWFQFKIRSNGNTYQFNGASAVLVDSPDQLDTRLDAVELTISTLGSAAFEDVSAFADQASLDIVAANAAAYTDTLRSDIADTATGASEVGFDGKTLAQQLKDSSPVVVNSIVGLKALNSATYTKAYVSGYYTARDGGGGHYTLDTTDVVSVDNGGTIIVASDGGRWKLSYTGRVSIKQFGAKGDNVQDDQPFIQAALDAVKVVYAPAGNYKLGASIDYKADGYSILGENMNNTAFISTGTHSLIRNPNSATTTRLFCEVINVKFLATSIGANIVLDWKSCQFGKIDRVWILGQSVAGCEALRLSAEWVVTECTYNTVSNCYFGLHATGISIGDGANNNTIRDTRIQTSFATGIGIFLSATSADRVSSNTIENCGFEHPGNISTGINVLQNCSNIRIQNNRFEGLLNGIVIGAVGNRHISALPTDNYFSSNTTNINLSIGGKSAVSGSYGHASTTTTASVLTAVGNPYNLTPARTGAGVYTFTFVRQPADAGYSVSVSSSAALTRLTAKSTSSFTITTEDVAGVAADASLLDVTVIANR